MKLSLLLAILATISLNGQPLLTDDFTPGPEGSFSQLFFEFGQTTADLPDGTGTIVVTDGRDDGKQNLTLLRGGTLVQLATFDRGTSANEVSLFKEFGGKLYFTAFDESGGPSLFITDGTVAGTTMVVDPDSTSQNFPIDDYVITENGVFFIAIKDNLYRYTNDTLSLLTSNAEVGGASDNRPGPSMTVYKGGVAFIHNDDLSDGGGLYLATDTLELLAEIPGQIRFDNSFGLEEVNGNLIFSLVKFRDQNSITYLFNSSTATLSTYSPEDNLDNSVLRWYEQSDSLSLGYISRKGYYSFDGINSPSFFYSVPGPSSLTAGEELSSIKVGSTFVWHGTSSDGAAPILVTEGTPESTYSVELPYEIRSISNFVADSTFIYFGIRRFFSGPIAIQRYDLVTRELEELATIDDNNRKGIEMIAVQDNRLYFTAKISDDIGKELYSLPTGIMLSSTNKPIRQRPQLEVTFTSQTFRINQTGNGQAALSVFDLGGRLVHSSKSIPLNTEVPLLGRNGLFIYQLEYDGYIAVRKVNR